MQFIVVAIGLLVSLIFVTYPLFNQQRYFNWSKWIDFGDARQRRYLEQKKVTILENVRELDFENEMGKLSETDYQQLRHGYLAEAHNVVASLEKLRVREEIDELISSDVRSRRRTR